MFDLVSRMQTGREVDGMMLLLEIQNDCYLACKVDDPHPRPVYFVHVTWDSETEKFNIPVRDEKWVRLRKRGPTEPN